MTEYLALVLFLVLHLILLVIRVFQRVGHHKVHSLVHLHEVLVFFIVGVLLDLVFLLRVLYPELRCVFLILGFLLFTLLAVGFSQTGFRFLRTCCDVFSSKGTVFYLFLVFLLDTA